MTKLTVDINNIFINNSYKEIYTFSSRHYFFSTTQIKLILIITVNVSLILLLRNYSSINQFEYLQSRLTSKDTLQKLTTV